MLTVFLIFSSQGVVVPEAIRKYMPEQYKEFIPFIQPAPIDEEEAKKQKKKAKK